MLLNNKYEYNPKEDLIGAGGFGRVYKAWDVVFEQQVALKMVDSGKLSNRYTLVKEVHKLRDLRHENLLKYYDAFVLKSTSHTGEEIETEVGVMEYITLGDIREFEWQTLSKQQHIDILVGVLKGLEYLHHNGIIHRDIKPANILIAKNGERYIPKIADFGISKERGVQSVSLSAIVGSFSYMSPEQM
jgi:serine/threonine protein kinase